MALIQDEPEPTGKTHREGDKNSSVRTPLICSASKWSTVFDPDGRGRASYRPFTPTFRFPPNLLETFRICVRIGPPSNPNYVFF